MGNHWTFLVAVGAAWLATKMVTVASLRRGLVSRDEARGLVQHREVPRTGGIALALAFALGCVVILSSRGSAGLLARPAIWAAAALVFAIGLLDDLQSLPAILKLGGLVVAGILVGLAGVTPDHLPVLDIQLGPVAGVLCTSLWVTLVITAWNFIDGLDGLAAGMTAVAALTFWIMGAQSASVQPMAPALAGAAVGFLAHNRPPARIFMGDSGSFLLGFFIAVLSLSNGSAGHGLPSAMVALVLAWPLADLGWAMVQRARKRAMFRASGDHFHYLLSRRMGHRPTVLLALTVAGVTAIAAIALNAPFAAASAVMALCLLIVPAFCARIAVAGRLAIAAGMLFLVQAFAASIFVHAGISPHYHADDAAHAQTFAFQSH